MNIVRIAAGAAFAALLATSNVFAQGPQPLRVCADPDYMPYSNKAGSVFENKIAQVVGRALNRPVAYVWGSTRGGRCDLLVNVQYGAPGFKTTRPYYISSYAGGARLQAAPLTIGAKPFLAADDENASPSDLINAVENGRVNVGITWDLAVGYFLQRHPDLVTVTVPNGRSQGTRELDHAIASHEPQIASVLHSYNITFFEPGGQQ